jgi:hypothetical protein
MEEFQEQIQTEREEKVWNECQAKNKQRLNNLKR